MNSNARSILSAALLGLAALGSSACGSAMSAAITPSESTTTLMQGWEHWFKLEWSTDRGPDGEARIRGYITNEYGEAAEPLRLLGQALDKSGTVVGQRIVWVEIRHLPAADHYRVSVWDYSRLQAEADRQSP
ncbi:MAG: hypothetical protein E6H01_13595 [Bacillati bacterium ANGP1]|uniref:Uncharacterized protein n=1 Tax=Candidatus Segetimicrobium genomatis TaxID=2569760 RepID=A0A537KMD4_9BACT|nr:MAG: hypothetical protein E6H01_13595 [Terrabacteria group bacterium ANGP1]